MKLLAQINGDREAQSQIPKSGTIDCFGISGICQLYRDLYTIVYSTIYYTIFSFLCLLAVDVHLSGGRSIVSLLSVLSLTHIATST